MSEEHTDPETHRNVEIGIDGKPFEAWTPAGSFEKEEAQQVAGTPPWTPEPAYSGGSIVPDFDPAPQSTMARNTYAWLSIGLGGTAFVSNLMVYFGRGGGLTWTASFLLATAGLYFGLRSRSVTSRGYSPQQSLGIAGIAISILAAVGTVALIARFLMALSRIF